MSEIETLKLRIKELESLLEKERDSHKSEIERIKTDNFLNLVKSYDYPQRTDYIIIGEVNTLASQYEMDIKLIDVSTQKIIASEYFNLEFDSKESGPNIG